MPRLKVLVRPDRSASKNAASGVTLELRTDVIERTFAWRSGMNAGMLGVLGELNAFRNDLTADNWLLRKISKPGSLPLGERGECSRTAVRADEASTLP